MCSHSSTTPPTPLFPLIPLNQEKSLLHIFCGTKILVTPLATPVPDGHLHRKCLSLFDFNSYPWVQQCGTVYPTHMRLTDLIFLLPTEGSLRFSLQYLVQIIFSPLPLENHFFSLTLTYRGLVNFGGQLSKNIKVHFPNGLFKVHEISVKRLLFRIAHALVYISFIHFGAWWKIPQSSLHLHLQLNWIPFLSCFFMHIKPHCI